MGDVVQIWQIPLQVSEQQTPQVLDTYYSCLSQLEKEKASRFRFPADKRRFVIARGTLRHLLARQLGQRPAQVIFCYGNYGKPAVSLPDSSVRQAFTNAECSFHFNLSHSGEIALCALGYRRTVGVDIESIRPIKRLSGMMKRTLVDSEQRQVESADIPSRAFLQRWTCKEAYLKAIGLGLTQSMQTVEVQIDPPKLLQVPKSCDEGWHLHLMDLPEDYVGALAVEGKTEITQHHWQHH